jgi:hypothetical protein
MLPSYEVLMACFYANDGFSINGVRFFVDASLQQARENFRRL